MKDKDKDKNKAEKPKGSPAARKQIAFIKKIFEKEPGRPVGAPRLYETAEELQDKIIEYFDYVINEGLPLTITGLTLYCGFSDRRSFYDYEKKPEFAHTIKTARGVLENHYETKINTDAFPTGAIFALKNFGWKAEEQIESNVKMKTEFYVGGDDDDNNNDEQD